MTPKTIYGWLRFHRRSRLTNPVQPQAAKFIARYDGPYTVTDFHPSASTVTLDLSDLADSSSIFPTFHINLVIRSYVTITSRILAIGR